MEAVLDLLATIRTLEKQLEQATDPRERIELAHTLDRLNDSLVFEANKLKKAS